LAQINTNGEKPTSELLSSEISPNEMKRNASFNLEEIKVRWKKAALENCAGVPCVSVVVPVFTFPGSPTNVTAVAGNTEATVSFTVPSSTGGSAITSYTVTSTPVGGIKSGTGSPLTVTGLTNGTSYTFTVVATNAVGSSVASAASAAVTPAPPLACGLVTSVTIDGYSYPTVSIGTQCWTNENLKVAKYDDGSLIPDLTSSTSSPWATSGARTDYTGATGIPLGQTYVSTYGYLYNWYAVNDLRKLCPAGWHVPTDAEWTRLETYLVTMAPTGSVGGKMKSSSSLWNSPNTGADNSSGFSGLPGGLRLRGGSFIWLGDNAPFWSASEYDSNTAWYRTLSKLNSDVYRAYGFKSDGAAVRCLMD
jgi:uncharacterized protein (TIGR02145 family)